MNSPADKADSGAAPGSAGGGREGWMAGWMDGSPALGGDSAARVAVTFPVARGRAIKSPAWGSSSAIPPATMRDF